MRRSHAASGDLFAESSGPEVRRELDDGVVLLGGFVAAQAEELIAEIGRVAEAAPFRHMVTPGGFTMSVAMTNCGDVGWVTDRTGYRYAREDPESGARWPAMPEAFRELARRAAEEAGFPSFDPDACLINRYQPGAKMSLHQDKDEQDFAAPIVSVSLGLPAIFLLGGMTRKDRPRRLNLISGDVIVWGGPSRKRYHGVAPLKEGVDRLACAVRYNLTFRKAL